MIDRRIYETSTLLGVVRDTPPPNNYWLNLCFNRTVTFDTEWIDLERVEGYRKMAPLVVPTAQGKPIYSAASRTERFKPAYLKPKDPISPSRLIKRAPGVEPMLSPTAMSPQQRYDAIVADMQREHRDAIERKWEWMAAQAILYGSNVLEDDGYPRAVVDFGRDPDLSVVLTPGNRWGDNGVSIMNTIEGWRTRVRRAKFGGTTNRLTLGTEAWDAMRNDPEILEQLNTQYRNLGNASLNLGLTEGLEIEYVGNLSQSLQVWVYKDFYHAPDGSEVPFMDPRDAVLTGPGINGVRCFGAIMDKKAGFQALEMFPKMWESEDPSGTFLMTQSAPLMVPLNPNSSFRARVVA